MTAAVLDGGRRARTTRTSLPEPGPDEVAVRVEGCGVCASSLPVWEGRPWFRYPLEPGAPGHEAWGRLEDGRHVAALGLRAFAEWDIAPADGVVELPAELDGLPFPGEALACAVNVARRAAVQPGESAAVVGLGFLGTAVASLLDGAQAVRRHTELEGSFDVVVEAAGTQSALDRASSLVGEGGRLVLAGYHQDGPRTVDLQRWNWLGIDVVNAHERDPAVVTAGLREAVRLAARGVLDVERLVTHVLPLAELDRAFELAARRPAGFLKAVVCP